MSGLKTVEAQIAALQQRQKELDANVIKHGVFDADVIDAQTIVNKEIRSLQSRRAALLTGLEDPPPQLRLRPPRRLTSKKKREAAVEICRQVEETALAMPAETPLQDLLSIYGSTDTLAAIEQDLLHFGETAVPSGMPCEFSEKLYAGFVALACNLMANMKAIAHFQSNQRRLLEQRISAIESRGLSQTDMQRVAASLAPQFDTAALLMRIEALEQHQSSMKYRGVWAADEQYATGNFCTHAGSLWHCNQTTRERPGDGGHAWTLAVKRGQDGKEIRNK